MSKFSAEFCRKYAIQSVLGEGGVGRVYLATDVSLARPVAIKFLMRAGIEGEVGVKRFLEEARVTSSLKHPNIVALYDWGVEGKHPFLVFQYVEGETLAHRLSRSGPYSASAAAQTAVQVLGALEAAHERHIVHRDLKPANILIRRDDQRAMLMDFGMAKADDRRSFRTRMGLVLGTLQYMAPEQIRGEEVSAATDVYAMGCVLFELLAGVPAFDDQDPSQILEKHLTGKIPDIAALRRGVPQTLARLIATALAKEPARRFAGAREMREALEEVSLDDASLVDIRRRQTERSAVVPATLAGPAHPQTGGAPRPGGGDTRVESAPSLRRIGLDGPPSRTPTWPSERLRLSWLTPLAMSSARISRALWSRMRGTPPRARVIGVTALLAVAALLGREWARHGTKGAAPAVTIHYRADAVTVEWTSARQGLGTADLLACQADGTPDAGAQIVTRSESIPTTHHALEFRDLPPDHPTTLRIGMDTSPSEAAGTLWGRTDRTPDVSYIDASTVLVSVPAAAGRSAWIVVPGAATSPGVAAAGGRATATLHVGALDAVEGARLVVDRPDGGVDEVDLPPIKGAVRALIDLDAGRRVDAFVQRVVRSTPYRKLRDVSHDLRESQLLRKGQLPAPKTPPPLGDKEWSAVAERALADEPWRGALRALAAQRTSPLRDPTLPPERRLALYESLRQLLPIDLMCNERGVAPILSIARLIDPVTSSAHAMDKDLPPLPASVATGAPSSAGWLAARLLDHGRFIATADYSGQAGFLAMARDAIVDVDREPQTTGSEKARERVLVRRVESKLHLTTTGTRARILWATFRHARSDFYFEVVFEPVAGGRRLTVTLWDPRPGEHYATILDWQQNTAMMNMRVAIDHDALPDGDYRVSVTYLHPPGVAMADLYGTDIGIGLLGKLRFTW